MDTDSTVLGSHFIREVQDGVKCAGFLRRIYEEVRQQKDVYNRNSFQFLSAYIWVYCGYGPQKAGIRREIDEALRPGIFALIDICSTEDLQYLHTVFGEGPCRSVLASLQQDYKLNFQYEGKV
nr:Unhealthy ribosome biogenesis 2 [Ipomoea batatas]